MVEGKVNQLGVYAINGRSTLLQALAQAQSPTDVANLSQVVIFRNIDGRRAGAVFDVKAIREGRTPDPEILGGDVIVVGRSEEHTSELQSLMRISYAVFCLKKKKQQTKINKSYCRTSMYN